MSTLKCSFQLLSRTEALQIFVLLPDRNQVKGSLDCTEQSHTACKRFNEHAFELLYASFRAGYAFPTPCPLVRVSCNISAILLLLRNHPLQRCHSMVLHTPNNERVYERKHSTSCAVVYSLQHPTWPGP